MTGSPLLDASEAKWEEARRCLPVIRALADNAGRTRKDVEDAAAKLGYGPTHVYQLLL